jgi:FkbM family methyltransferase
VYVEAGANDGISHSNTYSLEQMGWSGILIEPSPLSFAILKENRPNNLLFNTALVESESEKRLSGTFGGGSLMASADKELISRGESLIRLRIGNLVQLAMKRRRHSRLTTVKASTLDQIYQASRVSQPDLMILDVEGYELKVLQGMGTRLRPRVVIIETRKRDCQSIAELMLKRGYLMAANLSDFAHNTHQGWSGDHQDFAWCLQDDFLALEAILLSNQSN